MGPALGSDCRGLVVPTVVTQGHLFGFTCLFGLAFFNLGDVVFPRHWTSLSQLPLSSAKILPLTSLPLIGHRDPGCLSSSLLHPQQLTLSSAAWDGCRHPDFSSFSLCTSSSEGVRPAARGQEDQGSKNSVSFPLPVDQVSSADLKGILFLYLC